MSCGKVTAYSVGDRVLWHDHMRSVTKVPGRIVIKHQELDNDGVYETFVVEFQDGRRRQICPPEARVSLELDLSPVPDAKVLLHGRTTDGFRRFGTIAFDLEIMRKLIDDHSAASRAMRTINADAWFAIVPGCYRARVISIVEDVFAPIRGPKFTDEAVDAFVVELHRVIWQVLPSIPGEV